MSTVTKTKPVPRPTTRPAGNRPGAKRAAIKRTPVPAKPRPVSKTAAKAKRKETVALIEVTGIAPLWTPVQPATAPRITPLRRAANRWSREAKGNVVTMVCADTQIGYRRFQDGRLQPFHSITAMDVFVQAVEKTQPDVIVIAGDYVDLPAQSRWQQEASFAQTTQIALQFAASWLAQLRSAAPNSRLVLVEGNHDKRLTTAVETNMLSSYGLRRADLPNGEMPDQWPVISLPFLLRLDEIGVEYQDAYPAATHWVNGYTRVVHGTKANSRGSTTSAYVFENPHLNTIAGHTHRAEITWHRTLGDRNESLLRFSLNPAALCRVDGAVPSVNGANDLAGEPVLVHENWQQGFAVIRSSATEVWPELFPIINGRALYDNQLIEATPGLHDDVFTSWPYELAS